MESSQEFNGRIIYTGIEKCPVCGMNTLHVTETMYEDPVFGQLILYSQQCSNCGFRRVDIQYLESKGPSRLVYVAEDQVDVYKTYIFRSRTASIKSPELGIEINPGPDAEAMITTIEGLLLRMIDVAEQMEVLNENEESVINKLREFKNKVSSALRGNFRFTIIIEDPYGNSTIKPPSGRENRLRIETLNVE